MKENNKPTIQEDNVLDTKTDEKVKKDNRANKDPLELMELDLLLGSNADVDIILGKSNISFHSFLRLKLGDIVVLDKQAGEGADIFVNQRVIGTGSVQVINNMFAIKIEDSIDLNDVVHYLHDEQYISQH